MSKGSHLETNRKSFKRMFPGLAKELSSSDSKVGVNSVRTDLTHAEKKVLGRPTSYTPDVIDFVRRCDTEEQAEEIIAFMEKRGEIDRAYAKKLREQLRKTGVRSFGPKKETDYYNRHGEF